MVVRKGVQKSIEKFIDKGADVKASKGESGFKNILIRIHESILSELDDAVEKEPGLTRTRWIVEAIQEKLKEVSENERRM